MARNYEPKVSFQTPHLELGRGIISNLSDQGLDLQTIEKLVVGDEVEMNIRLLLGKNAMDCTVQGKIVKKIGVARPLNGYRLGFGDKLPAPTRTMIQKLTLEEEQLKKQNALLSKTRIKSDSVQKKAEDIFINYEADPLYKATPKKDGGQDTKKLLIGLLIVFGAVVLLKAGSWLLAEMASGKVPSSIPIVGFEDEDGTMLVEVGQEWMLKSRDQRQEDLEELIRVLHKENYDSAILNDPHGKRLARVVMQQGAPPEKALIFMEE